MGLGSWSPDPDLTLIMSGLLQPHAVEWHCPGGRTLGTGGAVDYGWHGPSPAAYVTFLVPFQFLQGCDPELCIRWQVLDKRIPLHANHKELLHKVSTLLGAYY